MNLEDIPLDVVKYLFEVTKSNYYFGKNDLMMWRCTCNKYRQIIDDKFFYLDLKPQIGQELIKDARKNKWSAEDIFRELYFDPINSIPLIIQPEEDDDKAFKNRFEAISIDSELPQDFLDNLFENFEEDDGLVKLTVSRNLQSAKENFFESLPNSLTYLRINNNRFRYDETNTMGVITTRLTNLRTLRMRDCYEMEDNLINVGIPQNLTAIEFAHYDLNMEQAKKLPPGLISLKGITNVEDGTLSLFPKLRVLGARNLNFAIPLPPLLERLSFFRTSQAQSGQPPENNYAPYPTTLVKLAINDQIGFDSYPSTITKLVCNGFWEYVHLMPVSLKSIRIKNAKFEKDRHQDALKKFSNLKKLQVDPDYLDFSKSLPPSVDMLSLVATDYIADFKRNWIAIFKSIPSHVKIVEIVGASLLKTSDIEQLPSTVERCNLVWNATIPYYQLFEINQKKQTPGRTFYGVVSSEGSVDTITFREKFGAFNRVSEEDFDKDQEFLDNHAFTSRN